MSHNPIKLSARCAVSASLLLSACPALVEDHYGIGVEPRTSTAGAEGGGQAGAAAGGASSTGGAFVNTGGLASGGTLTLGGSTGAGGSHCADGVQDGTETDKDCGGDVCHPCGKGKGCRVGTDCQSGVCDAAFECAAR